MARDETTGASCSRSFIYPKQLLKPYKKGLQGLVPVLLVAGDLISPELREKLIEGMMKHLSIEAIIPARRQRSCQRGLRKTTSAWKRINLRCDNPGKRVCGVLGS